MSSHEAKMKRRVATVFSLSACILLASGCRVGDALRDYFHNRRAIVAEAQCKQQLAHAGLTNCRVRVVYGLPGNKHSWAVDVDGPVTNLAVFANMDITELYLNDLRSSDISPLKDLRLTHLLLGNATVPDLSPLTNMPLAQIWLWYTEVDDLTPLAHTPLKSIFLVNTGVTDLSPLEGLRLRDIVFTPHEITNGIDVVRAMPIREIGTNLLTLLPAAEFWRKYDAGEFKKISEQDSRR
jgi:hypothetical protein